MTTKEIAVLTGLSKKTVNRKILELFPDKPTGKRQTLLSLKEAEFVISELKKRGLNVDLSQNVPVEKNLSQNVPVEKIDKLTAALDRFSDLMEKTIPLFEKPKPVQKQLAYHKENFEICSMNDHEWIIQYNHKRYIIEHREGYGWYIFTDNPRKLLDMSGSSESPKKAISWLKRNY